MTGIRRALATDADSIMTMLGGLHRESVFRSIPIEKPKLKSVVDVFINHPRHTCIVYESGSGALDGLLMGYINDYFFSTELGAWDLAVYVRPEKRGTLIAHRLWKEFRKWAGSNGARVMWLGTSAGIKPDLTRKFYRGMGMSEVGALYNLQLS